MVRSWRLGDPGMRRHRTDAAVDFLVVGLGNPGEQYVGTRHNVGVEVIEVLAARHGGRLRKTKKQALATEVPIGERRVALAFPITYMNLSGLAIAQLVRWYGALDLSQVVVVHDELDLPVGRLKIKLGGGIAGHHGLESVVSHLHSSEFVRVRIGVGKPPNRQAGINHVLRRPSKAERTELDVVIQEAADAVEVIVTDGPAAAMNRFNG